MDIKMTDYLFSAMYIRSFQNVCLNVALKWIIKLHIKQCELEKISGGKRTEKL